MASKDKLSPQQAALYRSIARAPTGVLELQLTGHEMRVARSLAERGLLRLGDRITAVPPWNAPERFRAFLGKADVPAKRLVDFTKRDPDEWKRPRTSKSKNPVFCVSLPEPAAKALRDAGADKTRALLGHVARLGHERSLKALPFAGSVPAGTPRTVYGIAVPSEILASIKGPQLTRHTGAVLRAAAAAGVEEAISTLAETE